MFPMKHRYSLSILTLGKTWRIKSMRSILNELWVVCLSLSLSCAHSHLPGNTYLYVMSCWAGKTSATQFATLCSWGTKKSWMLCQCPPEANRRHSGGSQRTRWSIQTEESVPRWWVEAQARPWCGIHILAPSVLGYGSATWGTSKRIYQFVHLDGHVRRLQGPKYFNFRVQTTS